MEMTHYMELLATNQPWHLIIFMAIPVILIETVAVTELFVLFSRDFAGGLRKLNRVAGTILGFYFLGVFLYLFKTAVIPLTTGGQWRGFADVIAVGFYLFGVVPAFGISLLEIGVLGKGKTEEEKVKLHAVFVSIFLVAAHVAMIFGMLDPSLLTGSMGSMPPM